MSDPQLCLWLIPALPLAASVLTAFLGPPLFRRQSHWPAILASAASCVLSVLVVVAVAQSGNDGTLTRPPSPYHVWFLAGKVNVGFTLRADALSALMLVAITFIGTLIAVYSVGYLHHEREHQAGYARYFA